MTTPRFLSASRSATLQRHDFDFPETAQTLVQLQIQTFHDNTIKSNSTSAMSWLWNNPMIKKNLNTQSGISHMCITLLLLPLHTFIACLLPSPLSSSHFYSSMGWPDECKTLRLFTFNLSAGIVLLSKELQPSKARLPMAITDTGRLMLAKEVHSWKAQCRMVVTDSGSVTLAKELQPSNAPSVMSVTDSGRVMFTKELHHRNAPQPMAATDSGRVMFLKELQPSNARPSMAVTDSGRVMLAKELHPRKA